MSCLIGDDSESEFAYMAGKRGWWVFTPLTGAHDRPSDVILFKRHRPVAVQIKTANLYADRDNAYGIPATQGGKVKVPYPEGSFDVLAAWLPDIKEFVFYTYAEIGGRKKLYYSPRLHEKRPGNWELLEAFVAP